MPAASAREALEALERRAPHVLVSDIAMPEEDGYSLVAQIRALPAERGGRIPAVALTAHSLVQDRLQSLRAGFQSHVPKPRRARGAGGGRRERGPSQLADRAMRSGRAGSRTGAPAAARLRPQTRLPVEGKTPVSGPTGPGTSARTGTGRRWGRCGGRSEAAIRARGRSPRSSRRTRSPRTASSPSADGRWRHAVVAGDGIAVVRHAAAALRSS